MKKQVLSLLMIIFTNCANVMAQDTLPKFSIKNAGNNHIIVSWTNTFRVIKQISVQRSFDSLTNYKTIVTVPDPSTLQNGFLDTKATNEHMFYKLYILLDKGVFLFSEAKKPVPDSINKRKIADSLARLLKLNAGGKIEAIKDADSSAGSPDLNLRNKNKPDVFVPSVYVFAYKNGYVRVNLPEGQKKYNIKFFEEDGTFLFELKDLKERKFNIDKSDFYHAGWFNFELYGDGKLIEKHKFFLEKEF